MPKKNDGTSSSHANRAVPASAPLRRDPGGVYIRRVDFPPAPPAAPAAPAVAHWFQDMAGSAIAVRKTRGGRYRGEDASPTLRGLRRPGPPYDGLRPGRDWLWR